MKIAKHQFHPELRSLAGPLKLYNFFLSRKWGFRLLYRMFNRMKGKKIPGLNNEEAYIKSSHGGPDIRVRIYQPLNAKGPLPVLLYLHGGGYAIGCPEQYGTFPAQIIQQRPCIIVAPDYRKSLQAPFPAGFNDCYDTLLWIDQNRDFLQASQQPIMVAGHSAGGGLTAAITLKARDTQDVQIAFQMPIYPMIDDVQQHESSRFLSPVWDANSNRIGWELYLAGLKALKADVPAYAAPARNQDYRNFPPTITFVGDLEPFRDETVAYAEVLKQHNIPVRFQRFEGCFHGFDLVAIKSKVAKEAAAFVNDSYAEFYDRYLREATPTQEGQSKRT
ncbi:MAG: alpha/beta hydrolase [Bacteroidota bacterium]